MRRSQRGILTGLVVTGVAGALVATTLIARSDDDTQRLSASASEQAAPAAPQETPSEPPLEAEPTEPAPSSPAPAAPSDEETTPPEPSGSTGGPAQTTNQETDLDLAGLSQDSPRELSEAEGAAEVPSAEIPRQDREPFELVGVTWAEDQSFQNLSIAVQVRQSGSWTDWIDLEQNQAAVGAPDSEVRGGTDPMWIGPSDGVAVRVEGEEGAAVPSDVKVVTVNGNADSSADADVESADAAPAADMSLSSDSAASFASYQASPRSAAAAAPTALAAAAPSMPSIITRSQWGAGSGNYCSQPQYGTFRGVMVHHTAGSNNYSKSQSAGIVRGIQSYHVNSQGWCDVGYNFLVDKYGQIFEGRKGGMTRMVRGAHAGVFDVNKDVVGISMMGNYDTTGLTSALKNSMVRLASWRLGFSNVPAKGTVTVGGKRINRISMHRDVSSTACPGRYGATWVTQAGGMRDRVDAAMGESWDWPAPTPVKATGESTSDASVTWSAASPTKSYILRVSQNSAMSGGRTMVVNSRKALVENLQRAGAKYYFRVAVRHSRTGERTSAWSGTAAASTLDWPAPTSLKASAISSADVRVSWSAASTTKSYILRVSQNSSMSGGRTMVVDGREALVENLQRAGAKYYFRVAVRHSRTGERTSAWSPVVSVETRAKETPDPTTPDWDWSAPTSVKASGVSSADVQLSWSAASPTKSYIVRVSQNSSMSGGRTVVFNSRSGTVKGLYKAGSKYYFKVAVRHSRTGERTSEWSPTVSATTGPKSSGGNSVTIPSSRSITLKGHGYGHGIGMSQNGAQGGAIAGKSFSQILAKYYPGTTLSSRSGSIRVLISAATSDAVGVFHQNGMRVRRLSDNKVFGLPSRVGSRTVDAWKLDRASDRRRTALFYRSGGSWYRHNNLEWGAPEAQFEGPATIKQMLPGGRTRTFRGALRSVRPSSTSTSRDAVNALSMDDYVRGVLPREMPPSWRPEALKAQAVAARTYATHQLNPGRYYDICDTTQCQVYGGVAGEYSSTNAAVSATAGRILTYRGNPAFTQFSASSGGYTNQGSQPYLKPVSDPWDDWSGNNNHAWTQKVSASRLESSYPRIGSLRSMIVTKRNGHGDLGGRVTTLRLVGSKGTQDISGPTARSVMGLKSDWFGF